MYSFLVPAYTDCTNAQPAYYAHPVNQHVLDPYPPTVDDGRRIVLKSNVIFWKGEFNFGCPDLRF